MNQTQKNFLILGSLCAIVLLMVVSYAAFNAILNINGTVHLADNWDIEITNIRSGNPYGGDAYELSKPTYTPASAEFSTGLISPWEGNSNKQNSKGSFRTYEVEISNLGALTGLVTITNLNCGGNNAIQCSVYAIKSPLYNENWERQNSENEFEIKDGKQDYSDIYFTIKPGEKHYLYINVWYDKAIDQSSNIDANINLELKYEQDEASQSSSRAQTSKTYMVTFLKNTSTHYTINSIGANLLSCNTEGAASCQITLPSIQGTDSDTINYNWYTENGNYIGKPGQTIKIHKDQTLYAGAEINE